MSKYLTKNQAIYAMTLFIFAGNIMSASVSGVDQDSWIAMLTSLVFIVPLFLIYARLMSLFPEMDINEILEQLFGKVAGKIVLSVFIVFVFLVCTMTVCMVGDFVQTIALQSTPHIVIAISLITAAAYIVFCGARTIGKWAYVMLPIAAFLMVLTLILSYNRYDIENLLPIAAEHSIMDFTNASANFLSFPYGDAVVVLALGSHLKGKGISYKVLMGALILSFLILFAIQIRNLIVLGPYISFTKYYTSYTAAGYISVGTFINRIEGTISLNYIIAGIAKVSLCLFALAKMGSSLFGMKNHKNIIIPVCLLLLAFAMFNFRNVMEIFMFAEVYKYVALPFQVVLPSVIWIVAEVRMAIARKKAASAAA